MAWAALILAGLFETFAVAMINRFSLNRNAQSILLMILGLSAALVLLSYSLQTVPMGTGYAVWTGISVIGSSFIGMIYFGESKSPKRIFFILLILSSAIGLKLLS